ncbi:lipoyl(octanoyl) transferase [Candidatus Hakubella thermalkaliphila]|uniref:Octanoyltransferase n=2 Tax=Candidatus Hakubella thermalkaliphila TaxID=2754717 RepID=A0A6V8Q638_9ACTN|nr:lipoyl(octanoyl) transferase LipB [Candidatus Hakubella thermalkaliphila]GFP20263.1 lipoyl(octanoyl) transferase [Candidatus Hakubella thermalkaliphila]GFP31419.1 lipoyl(octanoyl) transferase [Candidatus Hakubella thermalkaliphila]GFP32483.1 lipoyl(octanoyl) transferase [Candidatus Hakubella thermalkaliphila]GFP40242.1 lipoyl(octanoyl) transferase [Candidatus Hakubella thermalkaliphila]GFP43336.1 lipoyl(octanoyl) transferase [Candidatus Hakubella thermalkaliphila]
MAAKQSVVQKSRIETKLCILNLGIVPYEEAFELQKKMARCRIEGEIGDHLLLLEHPPVITVGRNARLANILADSQFLEKEGISVLQTDRGGDVTYHGPGQLVGYPILNLKKMRPDVQWYVSQLEESIIETLQNFSIPATRVKGLRGVWVEVYKIASIGVRISKWVTHHGFALNVNTNLSHFELIRPCGLVGVRMTSMEKVLEKKVRMDEVKKVYAAVFSTLFQA